MDGTAYIGIGSNIGDRRGFLQKGLALLEENGVRVCATSALYETAALYVTDQASFLNAVARIESDRDPPQLLHLLSTIELDLGRERAVRFGPRTLDLDILLWGRAGQGVVLSPELTIPHPRLVERAFVLIPLADVAGDLIHPIVNRSISALARHVGDEGVTMIASRNWHRLTGNKAATESEYSNETAS